MNKNQVIDVLMSHIRESFDIPGDDEDFTPEVHLFDYGYIDSFGATAVISFIEDKYSIEVTKKDLMLHSMNTVEEIADVIMMKKE